MATIIHEPDPRIGTPPCEMPDEYGSRCRHWRYCRVTGYECKAARRYYAGESGLKTEERMTPEQVCAMRPTSIHEMTA